MRELTLELHNTENPISNTERLKINENWQRIISGYSYLQQQIKVLAGGAEVDELIQRLNEAVDGANVAVQQAIDANNTATQEAIEANNKALQDALTTVSQTLVDVNKAITNANTATTEANTAKQGTLDATAQAQTALGAMQSLIANLGSKGVWNDTTQFYKNNLAVFNGSTFIALQDNLGKTPPTLPTQSNAYWSLFAEKGATGNTGLQGPPGKDGTGVTIIGSLPSEKDLPPVGAPGDAYMIEGNLYVWQDNTNTWKNVGPIQGPQGKSAYDLAVENGFIGTMEEWIESLKGMQGPQGPEGPPGPPADLTEINQQVSVLQTEVNEHVTGIATTEKLGHIKPDGTTITVDPVTGVASAKGGASDVYYVSAKQAATSQTYELDIPEIKEYKVGMKIILTPLEDNKSGTVFININGLGAKYLGYQTYVGYVSSPAVLTKDKIYEIVYNGTVFQLLGVPFITDSELSASRNVVVSGLALKTVNDKATQEFGTWTPALASPDNGTYAFREGMYVKTGKMVTVYFNFQVTNPPTGPTNFFGLYGLPFAAAGSVGFQEGYPVSIAQIHNIKLATPSRTLTGSLIALLNYLNFFQYDSVNGVYNSIAVTGTVLAGGILRGSLTYRIA